MLQLHSQVITHEYEAPKQQNLAGMNHQNDQDTVYPRQGQVKWQAAVWSAFREQVSREPENLPNNARHL